MSELEIEDFLNKVEEGLAEAQHNMLIEKMLHDQPVVISDGKGRVVTVSAKSLLSFNTKQRSAAEGKANCHK